VEIGAPTAPCVPHPKNYTDNAVWFGLVAPCIPVPFTFFVFLALLCQLMWMGGSDPTQIHSDESKNNVRLLILNIEPRARCSYLPVLSASEMSFFGTVN
jgi:hypothetical protein